MRGSLAQLVEQGPEEPCVPSSSLGGATNKNTSARWGIFIGLTFVSDSNCQSSLIH